MTISCQDCFHESCMEKPWNPSLWRAWRSGGQSGSQSDHSRMQGFLSKSNHRRKDKVWKFTLGDLCSYADTTLHTGIICCARWDSFLFCSDWVRVLPSRIYHNPSNFFRVFDQQTWQCFHNNIQSSQQLYIVHYQWSRDISLLQFDLYPFQSPTSPRMHRIKAW